MNLNLFESLVKKRRELMEAIILNEDYIHRVRDGMAISLGTQIIRKQTKELQDINNKIIEMQHEET